MLYESATIAAKLFWGSTSACACSSERVNTTRQRGSEIGRERASHGASNVPNVKKFPRLREAGRERASHGVSNIPSSKKLPIM